MVGAHLSTLSALLVSLSLFPSALLSFSAPFPSLRPPPPPAAYPPLPPLFLSLDPSHFPLLVLSPRGKRPIFVRRHEKKVRDQRWSERARERGERGGRREPVRYTRRKTEGERDPCARVRAHIRLCVHTHTHTHTS